MTISLFQCLLLVIIGLFLFGDIKNLKKKIYSKMKKIVKQEKRDSNP